MRCEMHRLSGWHHAHHDGQRPQDVDIVVGATVLVYDSQKWLGDFAGLPCHEIMINGLAFVLSSRFSDQPIQ